MQTTEIPDLISDLEAIKEDQRLISLSIAALREPTSQSDIDFSIRAIANFTEAAEDHLARIIDRLQETLAASQQTERG